MSLTVEWKRRVDRWREELPNHFYQPLGTVALTGHTTLEKLTAEQALARTFRPYQTGEAWGAKWEYAWFKGQALLPKEAAGERIVLRTDVGAESVVFVNGLVAGARDREHTEITLATSGAAGQKYDMLIEAYGGHGPELCGEGPVRYGHQTVPEPGPTQRVMGTTTFGIWREEVYQLWIDVETLYSLRESIDPDSLRVSEIDEALRDFTVILDPELPPAEMLPTVRQARARLQPLLACKNGPTMPTYYAFGHAHLDVAWLWPLAETERKIARTMSNQLALAAEYPDFKYLQSQAHLFWMLKNDYPELYARTKEAVRRGQVVPEGGMWVEADTNISGGEALIRQFLYGKRLFRDEFGVECELLWLPDVFGYSGAVPQILRGCGIKYFASSKIFWTYNGGEPFPYNTFTWEGIDGSGVLVHLSYDYSDRNEPGKLLASWKKRIQKDGIRTWLHPFGPGDGGGGPTRDHAEFALRTQDLEGAPRVNYASPVQFFHDLERDGYPSARYVGEIYFQAHRGTYTSQARTKRNNRKSELAMREAEIWAAAAHTLAGYRIPREQMLDAWRTLLLHQFHDILPGSSIEAVYDEANVAHAGIQKTAGETAKAATAALVRPGAALTVFNSLSWPRTALVTLPAGMAGATDPRGEAAPTQAQGGQTLAQVTVPACGWTTLTASAQPIAPAVGPGAQRGANWLENEYLRVELNGRGEIVRLFDKEAQRELAAGPCNSLHMYKDVPSNWDAWDIESMYPLTPVELTADAEITPGGNGPLMASFKVRRTIHQSTLTQEIILRAGSRRVDFQTTVDWQESHKLLKVNFPVHMHANEAVHEIQFGHIRRPNHKSRQFDADRFEVPQHKWTALAEENRGFAVLNDCKYGINVDGNSINLTLLKSALEPDMHADKGTQVFTYAVYPWNGSLAESGLVQEGYDLNVPVVTQPGAAGERSLVSVDAANVVVEAVKPAEDGSGDVIVRLYEAMRSATRCTLTTTLPAKGAVQTDMLENEQGKLALADGKVALEFRPFEIKTVRLSM